MKKSLKVLFMVAFIAVVFLVLAALSPPATQATQDSTNKIAIIAVSTDVITDLVNTGGQSPGNAYVVAINVNEKSEYHFLQNALAQAAPHFINDLNGTAAITPAFEKPKGETTDDNAVLRKYLSVTASTLI